MLGKGAKNLCVTNRQSQHWNYKIRWTRKSAFECYLTCDWKKFCKENGLTASGRIRFMVENDKKNVIHILKI